MIRALFVGGAVDNSELDLEPDRAPVHYPADGGSGQARYRLRQLGVRDDGGTACAVYAAPDTSVAEVHRISAERDYARRFGVELQDVDGD